MNKKYICEKFLENDLDHLSIVLDLSRAFSQQFFCFIFLYFHFHFSNFFYYCCKPRQGRNEVIWGRKKNWGLARKFLFQPLTENNDSPLIPSRDKMNAVKFSFGPFDEKKNEKYILRTKQFQIKQIPFGLRSLIGRLSFVLLT